MCTSNMEAEKTNAAKQKPMQPNKNQEGQNKTKTTTTTTTTTTTNAQQTSGLRPIKNHTYVHRT